MHLIIQNLGVKICVVQKLKDTKLKVTPTYFGSYVIHHQDNIKMDLQEVGGGCEDWMELAQDRYRWRALVSTVMNLRVSKIRGIS